jgi:hypothetical protein
MKGNSKPRKERPKPGHTREAAGSPFACGEEKHPGPGEYAALTDPVCKGAMDLFNANLGRSPYASKLK